MQRKIILLTSGTRGDVLPYTALATELQNAGLQPVILTHPLFADLALSRGLPFASLGDNPTDLMTRPGAMPLTFNGRPLASLRATLAYLQAARPLYRRMFSAARQVCQGADALVIGLPTFWAESLAEALQIPLIWAPLQPITPTTAFASALLPFRAHLGGPLNRLSHQLVLYGTRLAWLGEINRWRKELHLPPLDWRRPAPGDPDRPAPHLYGISSTVLPRPADWPANHHLTGFWTLPIPPDYRPPADLLQFLSTGEPPLYIGFGSMAQTDLLTAALVETARLSGRRIVAGLNPASIHQSLPPNLHPVENIPHDWLFSLMQAAVHHGGAGTTAASLRAGLPTAVAPVGVDQFFWGGRVWALGAGPRPVPQRGLDAPRLAALVDDLLTNERYRARAAALGASLRAENGAAAAAALVRELLA